MVFHKVKRGRTSPIGRQQRGRESHGGHAYSTGVGRGSILRMARMAVWRRVEVGDCVMHQGHWTGGRERHAGQEKAVRSTHAGASIKNPACQPGLKRPSATAARTVTPDECGKCGSA